MRRGLDGLRAGRLVVGAPVGRYFGVRPHTGTLDTVYLLGREGPRTPEQVGHRTLGREGHRTLGREGHHSQPGLLERTQVLDYLATFLLYLRLIEASYYNTHKPLKITENPLYMNL